MDENPITHPGVPEEAYHVLGGRTFFIFILERTAAPLILLLASALLFILNAFWSQLVPASMVRYDLQPYILLAALLALALTILAAFIGFLVAWLTYANFKFCVSDNSLKIKRGIFNKEEIAIPYRQIQDADLERNIAYRLLGVSRIVILTAGNAEEKKPGEDESEGILPALDRDLAEWLQRELLRRANVQKVTEENPQ